MFEQALRPLLLPRGGARGGRARPDRGALRGRRAAWSSTTLRERIREAIRAGSDGEMRDLARLAIAAFGRQGEGSGVIGVDVQRIRRTLGLRGRDRARPRCATTPTRVPQERLREFERHLRRELERAADRAHPGAAAGAAAARVRPRAALATRCRTWPQVHRVVAQLKRRLATQGMRAARPPRGAQGWTCARTMRASLETGGVPLRLKYRPRRPRRPELYVLCDVSTSRDQRERVLPVGAARAARQRSASCARSCSSSGSRR